ncbi:SMI1/KNR4 family protein [Gorillibacterium sp. CAU 1737]|uniref:SMI1/KNR4 family protein n=1 Tax=Gorillibacterium sp. CAU 1737 TaxID=3140362 RepID=UPI0032617E89
MKENQERLTELRLQEFEKRYGIDLPPSYRAFLLKFNGGYPTPSFFFISDEQGVGMVNIFYGIGEMYDNLDKKMDLFDDLLEIGLFPIADDSGGNQICLGLTEGTSGQIFFWIHDEDPEDMQNVHFLAYDFEGFLGKLSDAPPFDNALR